MFACKPGVPVDTGDAPPRVGDPEQGYQTLLYGNYVGAGIPKDVWFDLVGTSPGNVLERQGQSADLPPSFNLFEAPNGVEVVGGITCLGCHSGYLNGQFIPGLAAHDSDFSENDSSLFELAGLAVDARYGADSAESEAYWPLWRGANAISPYMQTPFAGVNPAFSMERAAVSWRDPQTLEWQRDQQFLPPTQVLAADPPAWWLLKKKERLYWTGGGGGDQARLISQISMVAVQDVAHYEQIEADMVDVLAWIRELEPPPFPQVVDDALVADGALVFEAHCRHCHGTYDEPQTYPSLVIPTSEVGTDPVYAAGFVEPTDFVDWLQDSWLAETEPYSGDFVPELGYIAPPLDGVWATAPYLHNGSVPDLVSLLDSSQRPVAWARNVGDSTYEMQRLGWPWQAAEPGPSNVYDTTVPGFGNGGHLYGDPLTAEERTALLEFLKTL